jgi:TPR repeat protein
MDIEKAIFWYHKSAEQGNSKAMLALARIYENGIGTDIDLDIAFRLYKDASE